MDLKLLIFSWFSNLNIKIIIGNITILYFYYFPFYKLTIKSKYFLFFYTSTKNPSFHFPVRHVPFTRLTYPFPNTDIFIR